MKTMTFIPFQYMNKNVFIIVVMHILLLLLQHLPLLYYKGIMMFRTDEKISNNKWNIKYLTRYDQCSNFTNTALFTPLMILLSIMPTINYICFFTSRASHVLYTALIVILIVYVIYFLILNPKTSFFLYSGHTSNIIGWDITLTATLCIMVVMMQNARRLFVAQGNYLWSLFSLGLFATNLFYLVCATFSKKKIHIISVADTISVCIISLMNSLLVAFIAIYAFCYYNAVEKASIPTYIIRLYTEYSTHRNKVTAIFIAVILLHFLLAIYLLVACMKKPHTCRSVVPNILSPLLSITLIPILLNYNGIVFDNWSYFGKTPEGSKLLYSMSKSFRFLDNERFESFYFSETRNKLTFNLPQSEENTISPLYNNGLNVNYNMSLEFQKGHGAVPVGYLIEAWDIQEHYPNQPIIQFSAAHKDETTIVVTATNYGSYTARDLRVQLTDKSKVLDKYFDNIEYTGELAPGESKDIVVLTNNKMREIPNASKFVYGLVHYSYRNDYDNKKTTSKYQFVRPFVLSFSSIKIQEDRPIYQNTYAMSYQAYDNVTIIPAGITEYKEYFETPYILHYTNYEMIFNIASVTPTDMQIRISIFLDDNTIITSNVFHVYINTHTLQSTKTKYNTPHVMAGFDQYTDFSPVRGDETGIDENVDNATPDESRTFASDSPLLNMLTDSYWLCPGMTNGTTRFMIFFDDGTYYSGVFGSGLNGKGNYSLHNNILILDTQEEFLYNTDEGHFISTNNRVTSQGFIGDYKTLELYDLENLSEPQRALMERRWYLKTAAIESLIDNILSHINQLVEEGIVYTGNSEVYAKQFTMSSLIESREIYNDSISELLTYDTESFYFAKANNEIICYVDMLQLLNKLGLTIPEYLVNNTGMPLQLEFLLT